MPSRGLSCGVVRLKYSHLHLDWDANKEHDAEDTCIWMHADTSEQNGISLCKRPCLHKESVFNKAYSPHGDTTNYTCVYIR